MGQHMQLTGSSKRATIAGYEQMIKRYQAQNCEGCPLRPGYFKGNNNRTIEINENLNRLKRQANELLNSEQGIKKCKQRCFDGEPVFANIKHNHHFKHFMLRGIEKVTIETGLIALAHNLRKKVA